MWYPFVKPGSQIITPSTWNGVQATVIVHIWTGARQSWKTSAHACSWLFLARFRSFDQWKFSPLNNVALAGDFLSITTFDKMELDEFLEQSNSDIPNTSCIESFRARKQIFQKLYTIKIFRKTIFLCLKLDQTLTFSLPTLFFHFKRRWFFSPIILNERALEPAFDAAGQWRSHFRFSALLRSKY